jgi:hypothetical protein
VVSFSSWCNGWCGRPRAAQVVHSQHNQRWQSWTCTLGFGVMGIWTDGGDGTDVNAVCRSHDGRFLVTADDHSAVRLFNSPCVVEAAPHRVYRGHCSHVACVRVSVDDRMVRAAPLFPLPSP